MKRAKTTAKKNPPKGKEFSKDYQPSPEAKSLGWQKRKARNLVLSAILKEVTESMTDIKVKGKTLSVSTLEALIKKMVAYSAKDDKALLRVMNMLLEYESRNTVVEQRQNEFERRNGGDEDNDFNDSFIQALNAQVPEIWET